ncbi:MAG TPA: Uma2 family endonuclease [Solirubrobacteraceae bacterium]|nr:Uma2 family endonuclease [Solirubrobacteraceae bacterium]
MAVLHPMSADKYLSLPEGRYPRGTQLIAGEVVMHEPLPRHQIVTGDLHGVLWNWTRAASGRGRVMLPLDIRMDDAQVYAPDLMWYADGRAPGQDGGRPSPLPDIVVEVRSSSTWRYDIGTKKAVYEEAGLRELWLVDTVSKTIIVFRRSGPRVPKFDVALEVERGESLTSSLLPGFALALDELFAA